MGIINGIAPRWLVATVDAIDHEALAPAAIWAFNLNRVKYILGGNEVVPGLSRAHLCVGYKSILVTGEAPPTSHPLQPNNGGAVTDNTDSHIFRVKFTLGGFQYPQLQTLMFRQGSNGIGTTPGQAWVPSITDPLENGDPHLSGAIDFAEVVALGTFTRTVAATSVTNVRAYLSDSNNLVIMPAVATDSITAADIVEASLAYGCSLEADVRAIQ